MSGDFLPTALADSTSRHAHHERLAGVLGYWLSQRYLAEDAFVGAEVLDFGGSYGSLALLLLERGAKSVVVLDPALDEEFYGRHLASTRNLSWFKGTAEALLSANGGNRFDLIVACSVTEHVIDLASCLRHLHMLLRSGGIFFAAHDNYYHPSGAHDNALLRFEPREGHRYCGPRCWDMPEKCEASKQFRADLVQNAPWSWSAASEALLTPADCTHCILYKSAHLWAHLLFSDSFNELFLGEFFSSGCPEAGLNKVTPFQLRQFIVEAGFRLELWHRHFVRNEPPAELLGPPHFHNKVDLQTLNIVVRARKA